MEIETKPRPPMVFPSHISTGNNTIELLDLFAGMAMEGDLASGTGKCGEIIARDAYNVAEFMIAEKNKRAVLNRQNNESSLLTH
jgi:hypothetical protein